METKYNYKQLKPVYEVRLEHTSADFRTSVRKVDIWQLGVFESQYSACVFAETYARNGEFRQVTPVEEREDGILAIFISEDYTLTIAKIGAGIPVSIEEELNRR